MDIRAIKATGRTKVTADLCKCIIEKSIDTASVPSLL